MSRRYSFGEQPLYVPNWGVSDTAPEDVGRSAAEVSDVTKIDPLDYMGKQATAASIEEDPRQSDN